MTAERSWIRAREASERLGVSLPTLYAYVSRGFVRSQATAGSSRERRYSREDVERLRRRTEERRNPDKAAARALDWGMPVLESAITLIDGASFYYRGHDAVMLSRSRSIVEVASLIWTGAFDLWRPDAAPDDAGTLESSNDDLPFVVRAQSALAVESVRDPAAHDLRPAGVAHSGWRILGLLARAAAKSRAGAPAIDEWLARSWRVGAQGVDLLRSAIILCADHELNVSAFAARCVASAGSNPYAVVIGGLSALEGTRHGGASARAEAMLESMRRVRHVRSAIAARMRRGESIDGFGHPLYAAGDPRAVALIGMLRERYPKSPELAFLLEYADAASAAVRARPNLDFALAGVSRVLRLPPGSPFALFAIARTIGWIGHTIEQYANGRLIRPRAKYVGIAPIRQP